MTKLLSFLFFFFCCFIIQSSKAQISFSIDEPYNSNAGTPDNVITDSTFYTAVHINSSMYEIASVQAIARDTVTLVYDGSWYFRGKMNIAGFAQGIKRQLKIVVRDVMGNEKTDSLGYTYARYPGYKIVLPLAYTNAYPVLPIKAVITGVDTLRTIIKAYFYSPTRTTVFFDTFFMPAGVIDTTVNISSAISGYGQMEISVLDKFGQLTNTSSAMSMFADYGLYSTPYYEGTGEILDFNYNRILEARNNYLYHIDTARQAIQLPGSYYSSSHGAGKISLFGAIYADKDWTPDSTYGGGGLTYGNFAGKYKTTYWTYYSDGSDHARVNLIDMETRANTILADAYILESGGPYSTVAANGLVAYTPNPAYPLYKYKDGVRTAIGTGLGNSYNSAPVTDGEYIVYQGNTASYTYNICLHNGISDTILSNLGDLNGPVPYTLSTPANYLVVNKLVAYSKLGTSGQMQIWLRDSTGNNRQATFFGNSSYIEGLDAAGNLVFNCSNGTTTKRYYLKKGTLVPRDLGPVMGWVVQRDSSWYKIEGKYIFKLNVDASRSVANGNWTTAANWEYGSVPLPNADVIVDTNITVDTNVTCNTLKVIPPGSITVAPGVTVTVLH